MKKVTTILLTIFLVFGFCSPVALGLGSADVPISIDHSISEIISEQNAKGAISAIVLGDGTTVFKGYGFADEAQNKLANAEETAFRIGSLSKTFVAIAALQLVEQGKLDMHASITSYLEADFPKFRYDITMEQLLTHTAGFEDLISGIAEFDLDSVEPLSVSIRKYIPPQHFIAGEVVSYSNYGISLAAYIVERIAGQDFSTYADENIFMPLGMHKTTFQLDPKDITISRAYGIDGSETREPYINLYPEGSVVSTATDMATYMTWLMDDNNDVLSVASKKLLFERHFAMSDNFEGIGYTWNRHKQNGSIYYEKMGSTINFQSRLALYPEEKIGVFLSINTFVNDTVLKKAMNDVTDTILGVANDRESYVCEKTVDISGFYVSTRAGFEGIEKFMNFLMPQRRLIVTGNPNNGFAIIGEKLIPIGERYYQTPVGEIEFIKRNGTDYIATSSAISYVRAPWYERSGIQSAIVIGYFISTLLLVGISIFGLFKKRNNSTSSYISLITLINLLLFVWFCILVYSGINSYNILGVAGALWIVGILIAITSVIGVLYSLYAMSTKQIKGLYNMIYVLNITSILFCLWMRQVNII